MKAVIIDDEANSRNALKRKLLDHCLPVQQIIECADGEEGIKAIEEQKPDIVFLDVEMPRMNGFTMLQNLKVRDFELIFTTAYDHFAIRAIRFSALDYLVKPIEVAELKVAVEKALEKRSGNIPNARIETLLHNLVSRKNDLERIVLPSFEGLHFIELRNIIYLEAESNYTFIHLVTDPKLTISKTLKDFEELLPQNTFLRIHRSHMINKNHISKYLRSEGGQVMMSNGVLLYVAKRKKDEFLRSIGQ
ncbi:MAG: LytTR family DNA-binding domain-containing protein [Chitinophagaceae bacterium]